MSRPIPSLAPLLLPFGDAHRESSPSTPELPERPLGATPGLPPLIRTRMTEVYYDLAHADQSGRLVVRTAAGMLGWSTDTNLAAVPRELSIVVSRSPAGRLKLGTAARLRLPMALRRRSGLTDGAAALLVADSAHGQLIIYSATALDAMIASWRAAEAGGAP